MSLFNWLTSSKSAKPQTDGSGTTRPEPARSAPAAAPQRKTERMARRELLYSVVRESMARAGVLSSSYKFKVLSLDSAGRQFLVMIDLAGTERMDADQLCEIESAIAQRAKSRHELTVSAVYWRRNDQVGVGAGRASAVRGSHMTVSTAAAPSQPAELASEPMPLRPAAADAGLAPVVKGFEPILDDEMEAFRAALADGLGGADATTPASAPAPRVPNPAPRAPGFADTQRHDDARTLSSTQHGDLT